jgi:hypothetical protein
MIDLLKETIISLTTAAKQLPARRGGKRPHVSTLYRWSKDGHRGVILETLQCGGTRCTSAEGLARFFTALSQAAGTAPPAHHRTTKLSAGA